ncbi:MAG: hypothetical protein ACM31C_32515 [Acidobacteriota bacterium]
MRSVLFVMFAAIAVVACAESPKHAQGPGSGSGSGSDDNLVCSEVTDTGSMFSHTECKPRDQSQEEREDAQRFLKRPRSTPTH